jgi:hypothetical protein
MTTQELKEYIDKVLGNSVRCLLPSFWWKRLFKLVVDDFDEKIKETEKKCEIQMEETSSSSKKLTPNKYYRWQKAPASLNITLEEPSDMTIVNNYMFEFTTTADGCTLSIPSEIKWLNGTPPTILPNASYQISIINNLATVATFN